MIISKSDRFNSNDFITKMQERGVDVSVHDTSAEYRQHLVNVSYKIMSQVIPKQDMDRELLRVGTENLVMDIACWLHDPMYWIDISYHGTKIILRVEEGYVEKMLYCFDLICNCIGLLSKDELEHFWGRIELCKGILHDDIGDFEGQDTVHHGKLFCHASVGEC